jgi:hypothetical protein
MNPSQIEPRTEDEVELEEFIIQMLHKAFTSDEFLRELYKLP